MQVRESYVNETTSTRFGDSDWYEPWTEDKDKLFRGFQKEFGGCTSHIYIDVKIPRFGPAFGGFTAFGKTVYPQYDWRTDTAGWVFSKRMRYEDARPSWTKEQAEYVREVWVHVEDPPESWGWAGKCP